MNESRSHADNYRLEHIYNKHKEEVVLIPSEFNFWWQVVGYEQAGKQFICHEYLEERLDPYKKKCKHLECELIETFGSSSNIIMCRSWRSYFREEDRCFGICYTYDPSRKKELILYRGKYANEVITV